MAVSGYIGARVKRIEDPKLIRGEGAFLDDLQLAGILHAAFVRSPHGHARIRKIELSRARALPGVTAAFAAGDLRLLGRPGWMMMFVYTVCAALRLARFNVHPSRYKGRFEGLPSPAAALMVAATVWFTDFVHEHFVRFRFPELVVAVGVVAVGLLMVSTFPYRSFKELDLRHSYGTLVFVVIALVLVALEPKVTLFGIVAAYVVSGPSEWIWRRKYGLPLEELPPPSAKDAIHEQH